MGRRDSPAATQAGGGADCRSRDSRLKSFCYQWLKEC